MTRQELLQAAQEAVTRGEASHASPELSLKVIADYWSTYLGFTVTAQDVGNMMILLKMARQRQRPNVDNYVDMAGYAAITVEVTSE